MKPANKIRTRRALMLLGALAAMVLSIACSSNSKPAATKASGAVGASLRPANLESGAPVVVAPVAAKTEVPSATKPSGAQLMVYRSRNYGVSFQYPWQYAFVSARTIANADAALRPRSDGHDGQTTLARIDIPSGFYPDTDFESGYFTLSLNQYFDEQQCHAALPAGENAPAGTQTINGVAFRWIETESGGRGTASRVRDYVAFLNDTCYELEIGVKTSNEDGLAREVDPDQVFRRLEAIVGTVKILSPTKSTVTAEVASQN